MRDNASAYASDIYDENIVSTLPYYREYSEQIIDLLRASGRSGVDWLDTGCGTGTLAARVLQSRTDVRFTLCDPSENMLIAAKEKLAGNDIRFMQLSSQELDFDSGFDIVTAVQCHHYLRPAEREEAVRRCFRALRSSGIFVTFENIRMSTAASDAIGMKRWAQFMGDHGKTPEEIQRHAERRGREVFPITIAEHIDLLKKCGFSSVNLLWASYLQAGFWAIR